MTAANETLSHPGLAPSETGGMAGLKHNLRERTEKAVEDGQEALENLGSKFRGQVRERPMTALVVASGIGLLLGLLIARKR